MLTERTVSAIWSAIAPNKAGILLTLGKVRQKKTLNEVIQPADVAFWSESCSRAADARSSVVTDATSKGEKCDE